MELSARRRRDFSRIQGCRGGRKHTQNTSRDVIFCVKPSQIRPKFPPAAGTDPYIQSEVDSPAMCRSRSPRSNGAFDNTPKAVCPCLFFPEPHLCYFRHLIVYILLSKTDRARLLGCKNTGCCCRLKPTTNYPSDSLALGSKNIHSILQSIHSDLRVEIAAKRRF